MARNPIVFQNGTLVSNAKVEVGGTIYDVTPAEYEGTTPLSANNLNQLQTNIYDYVDESVQDIYSTNETVTNKFWIDGKPIYRKTVYYTTDITGGGEAVVGSISEYKLVTYFTCLGKNKNYNNWVPIPLSNPGGLNYQIEAWIENGNIKVHTGSSRSLETVIAHIEYTKTTD